MMSTLHFNRNSPITRKRPGRWLVAAALAKSALSIGGRGKSGGARVIYLYLPSHEIIYLLYVFTKGDAANLSAQGKKAMRELTRQIKKEYHA
jgi:hypothetical protein